LFVLQTKGFSRRSGRRRGVDGGWGRWRGWKCEAVGRKRQEEKAGSRIITSFVRRLESPRLRNCAIAIQRPDCGRRMPHANRRKLCYFWLISTPAGSIRFSTNHSREWYIARFPVEMLIRHESCFFLLVHVHGTLSRRISTFLSWQITEIP
jgi:hypothetical protein